MPDPYVIGDTARLPLDVFDADGLPGDPGSVTLRVKPPSGAIVVVLAPTRTDTGTYHHDLALDQAGTWHYRWETAAPLPAAVEGGFTVRRSRFVAS